MPNRDKNLESQGEHSASAGRVAAGREGDRGHDANNPGLRRDQHANRSDDKSQKEKGEVPGHGADEIQPQDAGEDLPGTYEPDKRPSRRTTL